MARSQVTLVNCDVHGTACEHDAPATEWSWAGQTYEIDLCDRDHSKVAISQLIELSRVKGGRKRGRPAATSNNSKPAVADPATEEKYAQFKQGTSYACPAKGCDSTFAKPGGLAVHHNRSHGQPLFAEAS